MKLTEYKKGNKMKKLKYLLIVSVAVTGLFFAGCTKSAEKADGHQHSQGANDKKEYYTCTMHPQVISDKPGVCPICNMELIKKTVEETHDTVSATGKDMEGMIALNKNKMILANVSTAKVERGKFQKDLSAYSYLDFAEQNRRLISAKFNGRIEKLFVNKAGEYISKGEPLFEFYSADIVQAENEYLIALSNNSQQQPISSNQSNGNIKSNNLIPFARKKLELYGITEQQIKELEKTKEVKFTITYFSPLSGTVIDKKVQEGMYVNEGTVMYDIADMSTIWSLAEINEKDLSSVKVGGKSTLRLQAYPDKIFEGKITFVSPVMSSSTRTVKVRSEFSNSQKLLKPQMYGETIFSNKSGSGLLVPSGAVLFTGKRNIVWVKTPDGMFESRTVQVGNKYEDKYEVLSGLKEGEEVAATGGFLIDSESQLKSGMPTGHQHGGTNTNEKKSSSAKPNSDAQQMDPNMKMN